MEQVNIYVSTNGNSKGNGDKQSPFSTPERAIEEVKRIRALDKDTAITVNFEDGIYRISPLKLDEDFSNVTFKGEGNVVFNGGATLKKEDFAEVGGDIAKRLTEDARKHVVVCDLKKYGITKEQIGPVYAIGACNTSAKYDGDTVGQNVEIFWNGKRMVNARYPNSGFSLIEDVTDEGEHGGMPGYENGRNPKGGTIVLDDEMNAHMKTWKEAEKMWIFGYFYWDWADGSSPVEWVDTKTKQVKLKYASHYGLRKGVEYYVYNILEELDTPGEYYIDRESLLLYVYPWDDDENPSVDISLNRELLIDGHGLNNFVLDGITFTCTRNDAVKLTGDSIEVRHCTVKNVSGWGLTLFGSNNRIIDNEIFATGQGGIRFYGGDAGKLIHGNNVAKDNYVHDYCAVNKTGGSGIETIGCGNTVAHNQIENAPQMAIWYNGPENVIEYNYIKKAAQQSNDTGAIYNGRNWTSYGSVIRYNLFEDIGNDRYFPVAIYWDDTLAGQTAFGNIIKNSSAKGFLVGGGKDNVISNNLILNCLEYSIMFDRRGRDWHEKWLETDCPFGVWMGMQGIKPNELPWGEKYPMLKNYHIDKSRIDDVWYAFNPSRAVITNNIMVYDGNSDVCRGMHGCLVEPDVIMLGEVKDNLVFRFESECLKAGTFELKDDIKKQVPGFERIPIEKIGRYK